MIMIYKQKKIKTKPRIKLKHNTHTHTHTHTHKKKKKHRNLTGTKVWANDTLLFFSLIVWPEYQAFLGGKGKMEAKKGEISSPPAP